MLSPKIQNQKIDQIFSLLTSRTVAWLFGVVILACASLGFFSQTVWAATGINDQISFQGKVVNTNGTNVSNGNYDFVFKLYTVSSGGAAVWTETWNSGTAQVTVTDGIFQVNLGTHTDLPGSIDFNTDNIYLGIEFNSDGEMSPRVHFTAAPYAFNALKVAGLTVTDTTGTLTIPNGETISFGGSFTTSASNDVTLTTSGATNVTLPTTGTLATLTGSEIFTNKTIGSTGLTFSGATTDITTASGEDLTVTAAGAGVIVLNDSVTSGALTIAGATTDITTGTNEDLTFTANGSGDYIFNVDSGTFINVTGTTDGQAALTITAGDLTLTDGDLTLSGGDANFTLDAADTLNLSKTGANAGDVMNIAASSVNALDGLQIDLTSTADAGADTTIGLNLTWTESTDADTWTAINLPNTTSTNSTTQGLVIGTGYDVGISVASGGISTNTLTASSAIAANGGITFDASTDTVGAFTAAGTIDLNTNILTNIGNSGTDFIASTGALTLAGVLTANGGVTVVTGALAVNSDSITSDGTLVINASGTVDVDDILNANSITSDAGVSIAAGNAYTGAGAVTVSSATTNALTLDSGTTGTVNLGTGNNAKTIAIGTGTAGNAINIGTNNTTSDTIAIGSALDNVSITGDQWNITDAGVLTVVSCTGCGGGGGDLQTAYGADANGSDVTISLTTDDDSLIFTNPTSSGTDSAFLLHLNQQHTTGAVSALNITQASSGANAVNLTANAIDTEIGLAITTDGLTSGSALSLASSSTALTTASLLSAVLSGDPAASWTGEIAKLEYASSDSDVDGSGLKVGFTGAGLGSNTALNVTNASLASGSAYVARFNDDGTYSDSTPIVIDVAGNLGIGDTTPDGILDFDFSSSTGTGTIYAGNFTITDSTANAGSKITYGTSTTLTRTGLTSGVTTTYGNNIAVSHTGGSSNTITSYGQAITVTSDSNGTSTSYGQYIDTGTAGSTNADTVYGLYINSEANAGTAYGLYVDVGAQAGTEYSGVFMNGNMGIGDASPTALLTVGSSDVFQVNSSGAIAAATGITSSGTITFSGLNNAGAVLFTNSSGVLTQDTTNFVWDDSNNRLGIGDSTPDALLDLDFSQTTGNLFLISAPSSVTLGAAGITGLQVNLSTNVTATNRSVGGSIVNLPSVTNTGSSTYNYSGFESSGGALTQNTAAGVTTYYGFSSFNPAITQTTGTVTANGFYVSTGTITTGGTQTGLQIDASGVGAGNLYGANISAITGGAGTETAINIGSGWDTLLDTASIDITGTGAITGATGVSTTTVTASSAIAANGGITFDASTDTVGAFTAAGTIDLNTNILTNIGNSGTDFIASTGALTLAGVLTANGGITLASSQTFTASSLSYMDLGSITHGTTAVQGLRLPQAASASPSSPSANEGYLAWDAGGNQLIVYNGSAWATVGGGGSDLQTTYNTDADGSNATISLTTADDSLIFTNPTSSGTDSAFVLQVTQQNTTAAVAILDLVQSSNAANAVNLTANAIDTETGLAITTNALTSGSALSLASSAASNFTGSLASINLSDGTGASSNTGSLLTLTNSGTANANTSLVIQHNATGTGNLAFRVNDVAGDSTPFVIDGAGNVGIGDSTPDAPLDIEYANASSTAGSEYGAFILMNDTGAVTSGTDNTYGQTFNVTRSGAGASGSPTVNTYGSHITLTNQLASGTGTTSGYGSYIAATGSSNGTSTLYGTYSSALNADTVYGTYSEATGGASATVGTAYGVYGKIDSAFLGTVTTGYSFYAAAGTAGTVTTGYGLYIEDIYGSTDYGIFQAGSSDENVFAGSIDARGDILDTTGNLTLNDAVDISGALAVSGTSLTATSATTITLGSTGADTIILGNGGADTITIGAAASTGVSIVDNNWSVTTAGVATFITGTVIGSQTFTTNNIADSGALTIATGAGTALTLNSGTTGTINIGTDASAETINIGNTGAAVKTIAIGNNSQANTITIGDATVTGLSLLENNWGVTTAGAATFTSVTSSGAIAANGGITFDASTDTVGAFTAAGTIDLNTNILTNIGNSGTDFIASTGALTLAGVLTANGGITLASSQTFTASSLSYMDLGSITHGTTAVQGLRLPQAASASPSSPSANEGYLAWDAGGNQLIVYNGSAWATVGGGSGYATIKDESTGLTQRTTLAFLGAGVSCADNVTQTECTISGGSGSDLQGTYGADADGSDATISLTSADDGLVFTNPSSSGTDSAFLLQLTQQNTTAGVVVLDMTQSSNNANGVNLTANSIDGETGLAITANGLTSGKGIQITSSATAFTGNLADVSLTGSNAANTGNVLAVSNTGTANTNTALFVDHRATGTGNLAFRVNDESSDTTPFIIDGEGRVGIGTAAISESASTERLLQVGSETNRGNSVTYGEVVTKGLEDSTALTGIRDVYVYDTTADSDGGRWIDWATTDQLSWYTETLDDGPSDPCNIASDDRCYAAAFPRKAILVVTTSALYIFDAATNDMWMKFSQNAAGYALGVDTNNDPSSVTALNGVIYVGTNGSSAGGLYAIDFINDRMWNYDDTDRSGADVGIIGRNAAVTYGSDNNTALDLGGNTGWKTINDVSAAAIQWSNTAIAATTGPVNGTSFVALATDSGVNLINLTQQRLLQYSRITNDNYSAVVITKSARLYAIDTDRDELNMWNNVDSDVASQLNAAADKAWDETTNPALTKTTPAMIVGAPDALEVIERGSLANGGLTAGTASDLIYIGHDQGLTELHDHATLASGWVKYYSTTRQTAMLPASTRRAHMLDDASGDVTNQSVGTDVLVPKGTPTYGVNGVRGKAMSFNGTSQYLCSGSGGVCANDTSDNLSTGSWTISMWFKHSTTISGTDVLFSRCYNTTPAAAAGCVAMSMPSTGVMTVNVDYDATFTIGATGTTVFHSSTQTYNDNQWHFIMVTRAATTGNINTMIDGKPIGQTAGLNTTLDASQIISLGADCSVGAACGTGANFWDGQIDDFVYNANGGTGTTDNIAVAAMRRIYNDARPTLSKKTITVTDATAATSTTLQETGSGWIPNEFAGLIMEVTGSSDADCIGVTRRVVSNTSDTLTFNPAAPGACTLDTSADFEIDPESINGASNSVYAIGITAEAPLGEARQMCVGTNSGTDTGGVTCFNHQAGPNIVADIFHSQAGQEDDSATSWSGADYDDIRSIDLSGRALVMGSEAHFWTETQDVRLGQGLDYLNNQLFNIRQEIINDAITAQGSIGVEVGFTGGADLAERYYSNEPLQSGEVVAIDQSLTAGVKKTTGVYQRDAIGVVATEPGLILGANADNAYPIALVGRVPVKVTNENGPIYAGDRLTSASRAGYAMRATQAGRVLGTTLADAVDWAVCEGEDPMNVNAMLCTTVLVFVNLTDYTGQSVELAMAERDKTLGADGLASAAVLDGAEQGLMAPDTSVRLAVKMPTKQEKILAFLKEMREKEVGSKSSEVFTGRLAASTEVITPVLFADQIFAKSIKADSIEGLSIWTDQLASLQAKYAGLAAPQTVEATPVTSPEGLAALTRALQILSLQTLNVALDTTLLGKLSVSGAVTFASTAFFQGETTFEQAASFRGNVLFDQIPTFNRDTAGFAVIEEGTRRVEVKFANPYVVQPVVSVSLTNDRSILLDNEADEDLQSDLKEVEDDFVDTLFDADLRFLVIDKSTEGFVILLNQDAPRDIQFSWVALAVNDSETFRSERGENTREPVAEPPLPSPEVMPLPDLILPITDETPLSPEETTTSTPESETI